MFGLSGEHVVILLIILLIFGPRKLPELGNTLGKAIKNFKDSISGVQEVKYRNIDDAKSEADKALAEAELEAKKAEAAKVDAATKPATDEKKS
jgi:sec-independent protein translocase protein TatA